MKLFLIRILLTFHEILFVSFSILLQLFVKTKNSDANTMGLPTRWGDATAVRAQHAFLLKLDSKEKYGQRPMTVHF